MGMMTIKRMGQGYVVVYPGPDGKSEFVRVVPTLQALVQHVTAWTQSGAGMAAAKAEQKF